MSHKFSLFFLTKLKKMKTEKFVYYLVAFDPIKLYMRLGPQNYHQYLNFVKDINAVGKKMTRNGHKMAKLKGCLF